MTLGRAAGTAALLAGIGAGGWGLAAGGEGALGVLGGAAVALGAFGWSGLRLGRAARLLAEPDAPSPGSLAALTLALSGMRWALACLLLWGLLGHTHPCAVLTGLGCVPVAIWLRSLFALLRSFREPPAGAPP